MLDFRDSKARVKSADLRLNKLSLSGFLPEIPRLRAVQSNSLTRNKCMQLMATGISWLACICCVQKKIGCMRTPTRRPSCVWRSPLQGTSLKHPTHTPHISLSRGHRHDLENLGGVSCQQTCSVDGAVSLNLARRETMRVCAMGALHVLEGFPQERKLGNQNHRLRVSFCQSEKIYKIYL